MMYFIMLYQYVVLNECINFTVVEREELNNR